MAPRRICAYEPATVVVDPEVRDEVTGAILEPAFVIDVEVKRLTIDEQATYDRLFWRAIGPEAERVVLVRRPGEEQERTSGSAISAARLAELLMQLPALEQAPADALPVLRTVLDELVPTDQFLIPDDEIRRRRLIEMTDGERARYERLRADDSEAYARYLSEGLRKFVKVPPGQLEYVDEHGVVTPVTNGEQLALCYGSRPEVLRQISFAIRAVNEMTEAQKKGWRSRSASSSFSPERGLIVTGDGLAPIAEPVDRSGSVTSAAVMPTETAPSGLTAR